MKMRSANYQSYLHSLCVYDEPLGEGGADDIRISAPDGKSSCRISLLDWDTRVLGVPSVSVDQIVYLEDGDCTGLVKSIEEKLMGLGVRFATVRMGAENYGLLNAFTARGWKLVDILDIYCRDVSMGEPRSAVAGSQFTTDFSLEEGLDFLKRNPNMFSKGRIYRDKNIAVGIAREFYRKMFVSQFQKEHGFRVGVRDGDALVGFAMGSVDTGLSRLLDVTIGYLWLIGVAENKRGFGIGLSLLQNFIDESAEYLKLLEIGTQADNVAARRLYIAAGHKPVATAVTLHRWL